MDSSPTKFAVDASLMERIERIMPDYHHKRTFINTLIDQALTRLEDQARERIKAGVIQHDASEQAL